MAKQINIFIENRPGRLSSITNILTENNINVRSFTLQDRGDYGLLKLIVDQPEKANLKLADHGLACAIKDIIAVSIPDKPGNLHRLTKLLSDNQVNIVDAHGFVLEPEKLGVCCIEIKDGQKHSHVIQLLTDDGFHILKDDELYEL